MAYPKPLSEKSLNKLYAEAKITEAKKTFLHQFFLAAARLYGSIMLEDLWTVYRELSKLTSTMKIMKKDLIAFSGIVRKEAVPYYVFEVDELYCEEPRKDMDRYLVIKDMVYQGYGKYAALWNLHEIQADKTPFIPENLLDYMTDNISTEQQALLAFLGELKVTASEYKTSYGKIFPCENKGEKLKDFDFLSADERFEVRYLSGEVEGGPKKNERKVSAYLEDRKGPESEKIFRDYMWRVKSGWVAPKWIVEYLLRELEEVGVQLSKKQFNKLISLLNDTQNKTHLWCNCGWTSEELTKSVYETSSLKPVISFDPGIEKAISDKAMKGDSHK